MHKIEKAVIFDMDGTLVDNMPSHKKAWILFLQQHNIKIDDQKFNVQDIKPADEMIIHFFGNNLSAKKIQLLAEEKEKTYRELYKPIIKEVKGLTLLLQELNRRGIKIGLATMENKSNINFILDELNIRNYFQVITNGSEISQGKPNPEVFLKVINQLRVEKKNCVAIEDSFGGISSALNAGIKVIGITTTHTGEELLKKGCSFAIKDFNEKKILTDVWFSS